MFAKSFRFNFRDKLPRNALSFPSFNLRYDKNELGKLQVAVVVSKKVDKRATVRNRVKRKLFEAVRKSVDAETPLTLVFYIKKQALESSNLDGEISSALSKIK